MHDAIAEIALRAAEPLALLADDDHATVLWSNDAFRNSRFSHSPALKREIDAWRSGSPTDVRDDPPHAGDLRIARDARFPGLLLVQFADAETGRSARLLHTLVESLPDAVYAKDRKARFILKNRADAELMGERDPEKALGKTDFDYYPHEIAQSFFEDDMRVIRDGESVIGKIERLVDERGRERYFSTTKVPLRDATGEIVGLVGCGRDVTENYEMQRSVAALADKNRIAAEAKARFLAVMSHELRTPMTGVLGLLEVLAKSPLDLDQARIVGFARECGATLVSIVNDILDYSKISAGKMSVETAPFDLDELPSIIETLHGAKVSSGGVALTVRRLPRCAPFRLGDRRLLLQVLHNLVGNAIKFSPGGEVDVTFDDSAPDRLRMVVSDTGIGMTAEQVANVFEPFAQGDQTTTRRFGGTGLGLSIAKGIIEAMQGTLSLTSVPGRGTVFSIDLPLPIAERPQPSTSRDGDAKGSAIGPLALLAADDNPVNRMILKMLLEPRGHSVKLVESGPEAIREAGCSRFDALFMDISMPEMDGDEALRHIRAEATATERPCPPAIALTANVGDDAKLRLLEAGFSDVVTKPYNLEQLEAALHRALGRDKGSNV